MTFKKANKSGIQVRYVTPDGVEVFSERTANRLKNYVFDLESISNSLYSVKCDIKMCTDMAVYLTNFRYLKYRANSEVEINAPVKLCKEHYLFLIKADQFDLSLLQKTEKDVKKRMIIDIPFINSSRETVLCQRCKFEWKPTNFKKRKYLLPDSCPRCHSFTWWKINTMNRNKKARTKAFWFEEPKIPA